MPTLEDAIILAVKEHRGQVDKAGQPYILHVIRVMLRLNSDVERITGVLHDVIEDTGHTVDTLREMGYPDEVLNALDCLTKRKNETYEDFIERVRVSPLARRVKIADLEDNLDIRRLPKLGEQEFERLRKYRRAWAQLVSDRDKG